MFVNFSGYNICFYNLHTNIFVVYYDDCYFVWTKIQESVIHLIHVFSSKSSGDI